MPLVKGNEGMSKKLNRQKVMYNREERAKQSITINR